MNGRIWLLGLVLLAGAPASAVERLSMRVTPRMAFAPADLIVRTQVHADQANRAMEIIAESRDFYRSSEFQLDGDRAPRTTQIEFRNLPGGSYRVRAVLKGVGGQPLATTQATVMIVDNSSGTR